MMDSILFEYTYPVSFMVTSLIVIDCRLFNRLSLRCFTHRVEYGYYKVHRDLQVDRLEQKFKKELMDGWATRYK